MAFECVGAAVGAGAAGAGAPAGWGIHSGRLSMSVGTGVLVGFKREWSRFV